MSRSTTSRFFMPIKPRWLRRSRRFSRQAFDRQYAPQPVALSAARSAAAFWNCSVRPSLYNGEGYVVTLDLAGTHAATRVADLSEVIDAARSLYEGHQLAAHHAALHFALHMSHVE